MDPDGVDGEEERAHDGEAPREPVHVVEEVEGVRDRHEPEQAEGGSGEAVVDDLDADARRDDDSRGGELPGELAGGGRERRSSIRPNANTIAAPPAMPASSHVARSRR